MIFEEKNRSYFRAAGVAERRVGAAGIRILLQAFGDILEGTIESVRVNGKNEELTQNFKYLGCVINPCSGC